MTTSTLKKAIAGVSIATIVTVGSVAYHPAEYTICGIPSSTQPAKNIICGRQIKASFTDEEVASMIAEMKGIIATRPNQMIINEIFAMQDLVNFKCPNGFVFTGLQGEIPVSRVNKLLDGVCNQ